MIFRTERRLIYDSVTFSRSIHHFSHVVVELAGLFPLQPVVLLLVVVEDQVADHERWHDVQELSLDPPEEVWDARGEDAREGLLLEGGEVVLGDAADAHAARQGELAEALAQADQRRPHRERRRRRGRTTDSVPM